VMERFAIRFGGKKEGPAGHAAPAEGDGAPSHTPPEKPAGKEGGPHA